jgi:hypothetical protein
VLGTVVQVDIGQRGIYLLSSPVRAKAVAAALMLATVLGCEKHAPQPSSALADSVAKYERDQAMGSSASLVVLIDSLKRLPGEFTGSLGRWEFSGDQSIFSAIAYHGDSAVLALVECLDRSEPSQATAAGKPVLVGAMCFSALHRMAYSTEAEDAEGQWPGIVEPTATAAELRAAKEAWVLAVKNKRYKLAVGEVGGRRSLA